MLFYKQIIIQLLFSSSKNSIAMNNFQQEHCYAIKNCIVRNVQLIAIINVLVVNGVDQYMRRNHMNSIVHIQKRRVPKWWPPLKIKIKITLKIKRISPYWLICWVMRRLFLMVSHNLVAFPGFCMLIILNFFFVLSSDLQLKPYRTDEYVHKLYYETSKFSAFNHQWVVKARINNSQRDPHQSSERDISYQASSIS